MMETYKEIEGEISQRISSLTWRSALLWNSLFLAIPFVVGYYRGSQKKLEEKKKSKLLQATKFSAKKDEERLLNEIKKMLENMRKAQGCTHAFLYRNAEKPHEYLLMEGWESSGSKRGYYGRAIPSIGPLELAEDVQIIKYTAY